MAYRIGVDAGSKTIKVVVLNDAGDIEYSLYHRHHANIRETLTESLHELVWRYGDIQGRIAITGSAGIALAQMLGLPFEQEVVATTRAVRERYPEADAFIELGGEDAKVVYLTGGLEQRMNATCAGGTGGFIDTMAYMLGVRTREISSLALGANRTYPIASRCAVFAQTDVRPLLNAGARKADIAASALDAVVRQVLGGLACGRPIQGTVVFLGGPLQYIPDLVNRFRDALGLSFNSGIKPADAHLYTAIGAACLAEDHADDPTSNLVSLAELEEQVKACPNPPDDLEHLPRLFNSDEERDEFDARHGDELMPSYDISACRGPLYVGFDAGSTTTKLAVLDEQCRLVYSEYEEAEGDVLTTAIKMLRELYRAMPRVYGNNTPYTHIAHATVTGYGEELLQAGLKIDSGVVETAAHLRAALAFRPDASFVLDIGGQDMKALWVDKGTVTDVMLNEACSSGCGSFIEGTAHSLRVSPYKFSEDALSAENPIDLGMKCTVFMTSRVRHAQKIGATAADIAAGIAYSVVQNALYRIIGRDKAANMGDVIVVQGGAFKSDAVLRAFELVSGVNAVRPNTAHLMGAIGAALIARQRALEAAKSLPEGDEVHSTVISDSELKELKPKRSNMRCQGCTNNCALSVVSFSDDRFYVSGNRCDRALEYVEEERDRQRKNRYGVISSQTDEPEQPDEKPRDRRAKANRPPNVIAVEQGLLRRFKDISSSEPRGKANVGVMTTLAGYQSTPFWHTLLQTLGFSVLMPDDTSSREHANESAESVPSESVCQPAKISHWRFYDLMHRGADAVLMPKYERGDRCPVACNYVDALRDNIPAVVDGSVQLITPELHHSLPRNIAVDEEDRVQLADTLSALCPEHPIDAEELSVALDAALEAQTRFEETVVAATHRALDWVEADEKRHGIVVAGRPYHVDSVLMHGIDGVLENLGFAVIPLLGIEGDVAEADASRDPEQVPATSQDTSWRPSRHLMALSRWIIDHPKIDMVNLQSFNCGFDSMNLVDVRAALTAAERPFTALKIDEIVDNAHIRIRLRTLAESIESKQREDAGFVEPIPMLASVTSAQIEEMHALHRMRGKTDYSGFVPTTRASKPARRSIAAGRQNGALNLAAINKMLGEPDDHPPVVPAGQRASDASASPDSNDSADSITVGSGHVDSRIEGLNALSQPNLASIPASEVGCFIDALRETLNSPINSGQEAYSLIVRLREMLAVDDKSGGWSLETRGKGARDLELARGSRPDAPTVGMSGSYASIEHLRSLVSNWQSDGAPVAAPPGKRSSEPAPNESSLLWDNLETHLGKLASEQDGEGAPQVFAPGTRVVDGIAQEPKDGLVAGPDGSEYRIRAIINEATESLQGLEETAGAPDGRPGAAPAPGTKSRTGWLGDFFTQGESPQDHLADETAVPAPRVHGALEQIVNVEGAQRDLGAPYGAPAGAVRSVVAGGRDINIAEGYDAPAYNPPDITVLPASMRVHEKSVELEEQPAPVCEQAPEPVEQPKDEAIAGKPVHELTPGLAELRDDYFRRIESLARDRREEGAVPPQPLSRDEVRAGEWPLAHDSSVSDFTYRSFVPPLFVQGESALFSKPIFSEGGVDRFDLETARCIAPSDMCFTAAALAAHALNVARDNPGTSSISVPRVCCQCMVEAMPRLLELAMDNPPDIDWTDQWIPAVVDRSGMKAPVKTQPGKPVPKVGIMGNALLCFDPFMNDNIVQQLKDLGCEPVMPDPKLLFTDVVTYLPQLDAFEKAGVNHVVYLQSFGCLKGHAHARGSLHLMQRLHPDMPVTVIDFDPEASALNRENRLRLAVSAAKEALAAKD